MPYEKFNIIPKNPEETLRLWARKLEYLFNKNLNIDNVVSTGLITVASLVGINDTGGYYASSNSDVEDALQQIGSTLSNIPAGNVKITDSGSYYTSTSVEGALQELGSTIRNLPSSYLDFSFVTPLESTTTNIKLNYSTKNFTVNASSELDTIQDIGTTAAVSFDSVTATSNVQGLTGKFGNVSGGNYSEFEADGTLKFNGNATVHRDELQSLLLQNYVSPAADIVLNSSEGTVEFKQACSLGDYVVMNVQINHDYKFGSAVSPHLHWWQTSSNIPNWLIQYRWQYNGKSVSTSWTNQAWTTNAYTWSAGALNQKTEFSDITPTSDYTLSSILQLRLLRDGDNDSSAFATTDLVSGTISALNFDVHIEMDTLGSRSEYTK